MTYSIEQLSEMTGPFNVLSVNQDSKPNEQELNIVTEWYLKRWISYREYLRLTNLIF